MGMMRRWQDQAIVSSFYYERMPANMAFWGAMFDYNSALTAAKAAS